MESKLFGELRSLAAKDVQTIANMTKSSISFICDPHQNIQEARAHLIADILVTHHPEERRNAISYLWSCQNTGYPAYDPAPDVSRIVFFLDTHPHNLPLEESHLKWDRNPGLRDRSSTKIRFNTTVTLSQLEEGRYELSSLPGQTSVFAGSFKSLITKALRSQVPVITTLHQWLRAGYAVGQWGLIPPAVFSHVNAWEEVIIRSPEDNPKALIHINFGLSPYGLRVTAGDLQELKVTLPQGQTFTLFGVDHALSPASFKVLKKALQNLWGSNATNPRLGLLQGSSDVRLETPSIFMGGAQQRAHLLALDIRLRVASGEFEEPQGLRGINEALRQRAREINLTRGG